MKTNTHTHTHILDSPILMHLKWSSPSRLSWSCLSGWCCSTFCRSGVGEGTYTTRTAVSENGTTPNPLCYPHAQTHKKGGGPSPTSSFQLSLPHPLFNPSVPPSLSPLSLPPPPGWGLETKLINSLQLPFCPLPLHQVLYVQLTYMLYECLVPMLCILICQVPALHSDLGPVWKCRGRMGGGEGGREGGMDGRRGKVSDKSLPSTLLDQAEGGSPPPPHSHHPSPRHPPHPHFHHSAALHEHHVTHTTDQLAQTAAILVLCTSAKCIKLTLSCRNQ